MQTTLRWEGMQSSSPDLYSHKGDTETSLIAHLEDVMERCGTGYEDQRRRRYEIIGATHDFGKASSFFQTYLDGERDQGKYTSHAPISALACYYSLRAEGFDPHHCVTGLLAVDRHHRSLTNADGNGGIFETVLSDRRQDICERQAEDIGKRTQTVQAMYDRLGVRLDVSDFVDWIRSEQYLRDLFEETGYDGTINLKNDLEGYAVVEAYANLVAADKIAASGYELPARKTLPSGAVDTYVDQEFDSPADGSINELRESARREVRSAVDQLPLDEHIHKLTLPTGLGKTTTGLMAALRLRNRLEIETCESHRVVYAVPFTAIIDQNFEVYRDVLAANGIEAAPSVLLKHHHRSDADYRTSTHSESGPTDADFDRAMMLTERWESEIIATTFVQLFESLLVPTNAQTLKFPNLQNAVFLLDEVQSLPAKYWDVIETVLETITERWNCHIIAMTATQPALFDEAYSLIQTEFDNQDTSHSLDTPNRYFDALDRVQFHFDNSLEPEAASVTHPEFVETVCETASTNPGADILVVCNTVASSRLVFELLAETDIGRESSLVYLSSAVRPIDRRKRIERLRTDSNERKIIVSTQVVEAGVDIDMDVVYRDFAPLDSIVQAAGRCNRNSTTGQTGIVRVVRLTEDEENEPSQLIYDHPRLDATRRILENRGLMGEAAPEPTVTGTLVPTYFERLKEDNIKRTDECLDALNNWAFKDASLQLIDDVLTADVLITTPGELGQNDRYPPLATVQEALQSGNPDAVPTAKQALYDRTVSVNIYAPHSNRAQRVAQLPLPNTELELYHITSNGQYANWYDEQTGFELPDDTISHRIL